MDDTHKKITFYFQVWFKNKRSIFESLKRFRKVYPQEELVVLIAGIKSSNIQFYKNEFSNLLQLYFNIKIVEYLPIEEYPDMCGSGLTANNNNLRDTWYYFSEKWLDYIVSLVEITTDIVVVCTDDCMIFKKIPTNYESDMSGMITGYSEWMYAEKIIKEFNSKLNNNHFIWWPANFLYINYKKFCDGYNQTNKNFIKNFINQNYEPNLPVHIDFVCGLWGLLIFDNFESATYIQHIDTANDSIKIINGEEFPEKYPEDIFIENKGVLIHSYKTFRNMAISNEMKDIGFV